MNGKIIEFEYIPESLMNNKVIKFTDIPGAQQHTNPITTTPETVLEYAKDKLSTVIVIGFKKEDNSVYIASSDEDMSTLNFLLDIAKKQLLGSI